MRSAGIHLCVRGVAQSGSAPGSGPGGRRFESCRPDHSIYSNLGMFIAECTVSAPGYDLVDSDDRRRRLDQGRKGSDRHSRAPR